MRPELPLPWPAIDGGGQLPVDWWGTPGSRGESLTIDQLLANGTLTPKSATLLSRIVASGESLLVAASSAKAGKTTLLTALLQSIDPTHTRIMIRGVYDNCSSIVQSHPESTTLLVNEISPHLPIYCWGETLRKLVSAGPQGYQVLSTIHAHDNAAVMNLFLAGIERGRRHELPFDCTVAYLESSVERDQHFRYVNSVARARLWPEVGEGVFQTIYSRATDEESASPPLDDSLVIDAGAA